MIINASLVLQAAAAAAGAQQYPAASLYVVATPIGNLADLSLRALHVLALVDVIACEDTRHSAPLLRQFGIDKPLVALHEHNERAAATGVLTRLARGERVAYVSDAGTPAVSDPGAALVALVAAAGHRVIPLPGASSALAALCVAGDAGSGAFTCVGFLPARGSARSAALLRMVARPETQIVFEAPHRIEALAAALAGACATRRITLCRELTKQFETVVTVDATALPGWLAADANRVRGEFVLVLHGVALEAARDDASGHDSTLRVLLANLSLSQAVAIAASLTGASRNVLYPMALALKKAGVGTAGEAGTKDEGPHQEAAHDEAARGESPHARGPDRDGSDDRDSSDRGHDDSSDSGDLARDR